MSSKTLLLNTPTRPSIAGEEELADYEQYDSRRGLFANNVKNCKNLLPCLQMAVLLIAVLLWCLLGRSGYSTEVMVIAIFYAILSPVLIGRHRFLDWQTFGSKERIVTLVSVGVDVLAYVFLMAFIGMCAFRADLVASSHNTAWIAMWATWVTFWMISEIFSLVPLFDRIARGRARPADNHAARVEAAANEDSQLTDSYSESSVGYGTQSRTEVSEDIEL